MARAIWSGAVSFGLVSLPVKAHSATRDKGVRFNQLEKDTGARIRYRKVSGLTGDEVEPDRIERGYQVSRDHYVTVSDEELEQVRPEASHRIDIESFIELAEIDPIHFDTTYWLAPDGRAAERAYALLCAVMQDRGRVGIGRVVLRSKQHLVALRPLQDALAMTTMHFADAIVPAASVDAPTDVEVPERERELAHQIVDSMTQPWDPAAYHDDYTEQLRELLERKAAGEEVVVAPSGEERQDAEVFDLMAALEASAEAMAEKSTGTRKAKRSRKTA